MSGIDSAFDSNEGFAELEVVSLKTEIARLRDDRERLIQLVKELIYGDPSFVADEYWAKQLLSEIEERK